jgi:hypothetical protein
MSWEPREFAPPLTLETWQTSVDEAEMVTDRSDDSVATASLPSPCPHAVLERIVAPSMAAPITRFRIEAL